MKTALRFLPGLCVLAGLLLLTQTGTAQPLNDYDLYVYNASSGTTQQVTSLPGVAEFNPDWSPRGRHLVHDVAQFDAGDGFIKQDLYLTDAATGTSTPLAGGEDGNDAAWSPNGRWIAFDKVPVDAGLYVVPAAGGSPTLVLSDATEPDWSPNGKCIVFHRPSGGTVHTLNRRTGAVNVIAQGYNPAWSPNGRYIAYVLDGDVFSIRVNGRCQAVGGGLQLTTDPADDSQPAWTHNSRRVVFHSFRSGDYDLWSVPANASAAPVPVTGAVGANDFDPAVYKRLVAYAAATPPAAAKTARVDAKTGLAREAAFGLSSYPNPFNPSTTIRFTLAEAGPVTLKVYDMAGREVATLLNGTRAAGDHAVRFEAGAALPSGVYLYRLQVGAQGLTKRFTLLK